jgi:Protein of unknown function DUF262
VSNHNPIAVKHDVHQIGRPSWASFRSSPCSDESETPRSRTGLGTGISCCSSAMASWPTNADRSTFRLILSAKTPEGLLKESGLTAKSELPRMIGAYLYFHSQIKAFASAVENLESIDHHIFGLFQAMRTGLQLVVIELEENDDPQVIFETLNARGQPLLPSDLIRNTVFQQATADPEHAANEHYADEL